MSGIFSNNLITKDEVKVLTGLDLDNIQFDDNPSNRAERLIYQAQSTLYSYIKENYKNDLYIWYRKYSSEEKRNHIKMAIAYQVKYLIFNGDIGNDSELYDSPKSMVKINARKVSSNAISELAHCGNLCSNRVQKRRLLGDFLDIELNGY